MHVVVNAAMSADGKLSTRRRTQVAISGPNDFDRVETLRGQSDAVVVGVGTVLADDPQLTIDGRSTGSDSGTERPPYRVVADSTARTPPDASILDDSAETVLFVSDAAPEQRVTALEAGGAEVHTVGRERVDLPRAMKRLESMGVERAMVEGGGELIFSLFEESVVDELSVFVGSMIIGGRDAPTLADGDGFLEEFVELTPAAIERIDDGLLILYTVED